jgi:hypothetical protein
MPIYSTAYCARQLIYLRVIQDVLQCVIHPDFQSRYIKLPTSQTVLPTHITNNPKFFPWFKGAIAAIDGTHISVSTTANSRAAHRNRKGELSQNVLAACTFDMYFCYVLSGMEGSASDSFIYDFARGTRCVAVDCQHLYV